MIEVCPNNTNTQYGEYRESELGLLHGFLKSRKRFLRPPLWAGLGWAAVGWAVQCSTKSVAVTWFS